MNRSLQWRAARAEDAAAIATAIETWWERHLEHFVHPLVLEHVGDTCLVVDDDGVMVAFLVGLLSQRYPEAAYVHFIGVHPDYRGRGLARELYERFFDLVRAHGRTLVIAETGAFNDASIAFHQRLGFSIVGGIDGIGDVAVQRDFHGTGEDVVQFVKRLDDAEEAG